MGGGGVLLSVKSDLNPDPQHHALGEHMGKNIIERPRALLWMLLSPSKRAL